MKPSRRLSTLGRGSPNRADPAQLHLFCVSNQIPAGGFWLSQRLDEITRAIGRIRNIIIPSCYGLRVSEWIPSRNRSSMTWTRLGRAYPRANNSRCSRAWLSCSLQMAIKIFFFLKGKKFFFVQARMHVYRKCKLVHGVVRSMSDAVHGGSVREYASSYSRSHGSHNRR